MTIVDTRLAPTTEGVFICPGCDRLAVRWADLHNSTCADCEAATR